MERNAHAARGARCTDVDRVYDKLIDPFPGECVRWVVAQVDGTRAFVVPYVPAQHFKDRLDSVLAGWKKSLVILDSEGVQCLLEIEGVTQEGTALINEQDGLNENFRADKAFIRACQKFGLGHYLQYLPGQWVDYDLQAHKVISPVPTLPAWALPGGTGCPTNVPGKAQCCKPHLAPKTRLNTAQPQLTPEKQGDHEIANAQALNAWEVLVFKARKTGISDIDPIVLPVTVGDLRKRYKELKDLMSRHS